MSPKLSKIVNVPPNNETTPSKIKTKNTKTSSKTIKLTIKKKIQRVANLKFLKKNPLYKKI
jgi:hypothetical protein